MSEDLRDGPSGTPRATDPTERTDATGARHGVRPAWLLGACVVSALFTAWRGSSSALANVFLDAGVDAWRGPWSAACAAAVAACVLALVFRGFPEVVGRGGAALAAWLVSWFAAAQGIGDPATAMAVGGSLGVLAAFVGFFVFGVEGEGGVAWAFALAAGIGGIVAVAGAMGALHEWGRDTGRAWAEHAGGALGLGLLGVAGGVPAAAVLLLRERLARYDGAFVNAFAGALAGALAVSVAWAFGAR